MKADGSRILLVPLVPPYIESLRPYEAGRTLESVRREYGLARIAKLASNENPLGASPKAVEAMARALGELNVYPDGGLALREVLARQFELKVENVIAGSGSEDGQDADILHPVRDHESAPRQRFGNRFAKSQLGNWFTFD